MLFRVASAALACGLLLSACDSRVVEASRAIHLSGAGSNSDGILFAKAFAEYSRITPGVVVDYASIGSGAGIARFTSHTVDFGATDIPMNARELALYAGGARAVLQLPVALDGAVLAYNIPGFNHEYIPPRIVLRLSPEIIAGIFLGKITMWNDAGILADNPDLKLPALPIKVVHREDSCGPTYVLTDYLSRVSSDWKSQVGTGKTVTWKPSSSLAAQSNEAVDALIKKVPGSIGYVALPYALAGKMEYAAVRNRSGRYVLPSMASLQAAAAQRTIVSPTAFSIVDQPGHDTYPIAAYSWLLLERTNRDAAKGAALCAFARWMLSDGQKFAPSVDYAPLPAAVSKSAMAAVGRCSGTVN